MKFPKFSKRTIFVLVAILLLAVLAWWGLHGRVFKSDRDLAYMSATEQIEKFKNGELSPVDVLKAQLKMIESYNGEVASRKEEVSDCLEFNGKVNAISFENYEEALEQAKEAEKRYKNGTARPLEGITIGVKDDNAVKGWVVDAGSLLYKDKAPAKEDDVMMERLREAGAIFVFQTTVPEFYCNISTWSRLYGVTRNPWNEYYSVGGSSGGSCAALAAGFCTIATGSDVGGSIRLPSSMCGVYGFRPPFGRVPQEDLTPWCTIGAQARTMKDLVLVQNVIAGPSAKDMTSITPKLEYPFTYPDLRGVKIAVDYFENWTEGGIDKEEKEAMDKVVAALKKAGAEVVEVQLSWTSELIRPYAAGLTATSSMGGMLANVDPTSDLLTPYVAKLLRITPNEPGAVRLAKADKLTKLMHREVQEKVFSQGCIALITPIFTTPHVPADYGASDDKVAFINGKPAVLGQVFMTFPWNFLYTYPIVAVPAMLSKESVPIGVQVVGNTYQDLDAFRVAMGLSKLLPQLYRGDRFPSFTNKKMD